MKKLYIIPVLLTLFVAISGHAATISWAVTTLPNPVSEPSPGLGVGFSITKAVLVYTTLGLPIYEDSALTSGTQIGSEVTEIYPWGIGEQLSEDVTPRTTGNYFVVLFASNGSTTYYATSTTGLVWNNTAKISSDPMAPASESYDPSAAEAGGFGAWTPVPEPSSAALLFAGLATVLLRRRRNVA